MAEPYLTADQIIDRLSDEFPDYGTVEIGEGDARLASDVFDAKAPFKGIKLDGDQEREYPRYGETEVPDAVLDAVSLIAYQLSVDDEAPVTSESAGRVSVSYGRPKMSKTDRRIAALVRPLRVLAAARIV